ncbi:hypothetical protein ARAM_002838 [Aspergillus rambellii]|uniref:NmrA-like domain-containing protein n=1 Tax=Aspergillus rambellii TaxID=308745 RepID=A0A0F8WUE1_9EURO|nr:hypothetical protein ARAM_002838 [Aspergillus rambellii]
MAKIGVFPAAGGLGFSIVNHLLRLVPPSQLILIARDPGSLALAEQKGAVVRYADYDDAAPLAHAFDGVDILMLISYASFEMEHRVNAHRIAIDAACQSGVQHIFYSSLAFAGEFGETSVAHVMGAHLATEKYLAQLPEPTTYTIVREGLYSESFPIYTAWFDLKAPTDEITIPHDGSGPGVSWAKRDELGEATAKLIVSYANVESGNVPAEFPYINKTVLLTGPRAFSLQETVDILGKVVGRPVRIRPISVDEYVKLPHEGKLTHHGVDLSREWATAWDAIRLGETAVVTPTLWEILGREPEDYETTLQGLYELGV